MAQWRQQLLCTTTYITSSKIATRDLDLKIHRNLCKLLMSEEAIELSAPISGDARYLLFFDGGSRGNPGRGGSGSVVVTFAPGDHSPHLVWAAAMSYSSRSTTNNLAEYRGLRNGLQAARDHHWHPLHVVGDSRLILDQMRCRRPPKSASLRHEYSLAQQLADGLVIAGWHHHYRDYNKMADKAANIAMDERASTQVYGHSDRLLANAVRSFMSQDVSHWSYNQWEHVGP